jgi:hypothetical protein
VEKRSFQRFSRTRFLIPHSSFSFSGTLVMMPPPSMKEFNITRVSQGTNVKIDVAAKHRVAGEYHGTCSR